MTRRTPYRNQQRTLDQKRAYAVQLVTMRRSLEGFGADDLARISGLSLPEATALIERERMMRGARHG